MFTRLFVQSKRFHGRDGRASRRVALFELIFSIVGLIEDRLTFSLIDDCNDEFWPKSADDGRAKS
jgi:hypothetical protein